MRILLLLPVFFWLTNILSGQAVYAVRETLRLSGDVATEGAVLHASLPLTAGGQEVSQVLFSTAPAARNGTDYRWDLDRMGQADSLRISYRVKVAPTPAWDPDSLAQLPQPGFSWPEPEAGTGPYILPPLLREDVDKTELGTLEPGDTSLADVDRLIRRLGRRVRTVRSTEGFDYGQPLLEDLYRRRTTARRKHLLLSLALQYLELPHRLVAGKVLSYGEVRENELWVEIPVSGRWYRVYYGDGIDRRDWGLPDEPDRFLACSYDWRHFTLEVIHAPGMPPVPTTLSGEYTNVVLDFWIAKDEALSRQRYAQALVYLDSVLTYLPRSVVAVSEVGLVYTQAGRPQDGLPYLQQALRLAATPADQSLAMVQMAKYFSLQQQAEESLQALARAYRLTPVDLSVIYTDPRFQFLARQADLEQRLSAYVRRLD